MFDFYRQALLISSKNFEGHFIAIFADIVYTLKVEIHPINYQTSP